MGRAPPGMLLLPFALRAKELGMKVIAAGSAAGFKDVASRHSSGKKLFDIADVVIDSCVPSTDAAVPIRDHYDKLGPL